MNASVHLDERCWPRYNQHLHLDVPRMAQGRCCTAFLVLKIHHVLYLDLLSASWLAETTLRGEIGRKMAGLSGWEGIAFLRTASGKPGAQIHTRLTAGTLQGSSLQRDQKGVHWEAAGAGNRSPCVGTCGFSSTVWVAQQQQLLPLLLRTSPSSQP